MDMIYIGMVGMGADSLPRYDTGAALRLHCKIPASTGLTRRNADRRAHGVGVRLRMPNVE
ncbi:hypothetical protein [Sphingomonas albertensis]|uniref:Uncharacterized protein n=1 Tax=Sphingomonas albertensis TaxID=2762591 RepID=A0ABR7AKV6_9SPHN|nr:hypothetical protein [Sphingomonas albertensis]MBC3941095.1 hypothetical protein [Sphingomonas albertensis]